MCLKFAVFAVLFVVQVHAEKCTTPHNKQGDCVPLPSCTKLYDALHVNASKAVEEYVEKSICSGTKFLPMVCCETNNSISDKNKKSLLPGRNQCGFQHSDDYFRAPNDTSVRINEFPWLARIIHEDSPNSSESGVLIECAGSLISNRYVLTSAFCVDEELYLPLGVRLGEFYVKNDTDCVQEPPFEEECSSFEDFTIEKIIRHPNYSNVYETNDIALLRLNRTVIYTDYIRPICLPFADTVRATFGDSVTTSGWVYYHRVADHKKRIMSTLITTERCKKDLNSTAFSRVGRNMTENNICTIQLNKNSQMECNSDLGGPVMFSQRFQWHQEAVVFFAVGCRLTGMPEVHTRLTTAYVDWIKGTLEP